MQITRRKTRQIKVGGVAIGGGAPPPAGAGAAGAPGGRAERVAVPDTPSAEALPEIRRQTALPLVADIHFDYKLALKALDAGVDCLRINPGNIGDRDKVERVVAAAKERRTPMRIGVNAGSLEREILERHGFPTAEGMVESALSHIRILEELDFYDIKVSLKASNVGLAAAAYRAFSAVSDYPVHLGITQAGTTFSGGIKSAVGLGILLAEGIGDTIRVSLAADPVEEVKTGYEI